MDSENYKDLLELMQSKSLSSCSIIKIIFDFSALYISNILFLHSKLKERLKELVQLNIFTKNINLEIRYLVYNTLFSETGIIKLLQFLFDIYVLFGGRVF